MGGGTNNRRRCLQIAKNLIRACNFPLGETAITKTGACFLLAELLAAGETPANALLHQVTSPQGFDVTALISNHNDTGGNIVLLLFRNLALSQN